MALFSLIFNENSLKPNVDVRWQLTFLLELRQETDVAVEEQAQVVHAIAQHGQRSNPMPKAKPM